MLVTRGHRHDWYCLRQVIDSRAGYIGMIGSRRRVRAARLGLEAEGVTAERLSRVAAPVGLDIGAETPEEIAVAILAEIVLARRGGTGHPLSSVSIRVRFVRFVFSMELDVLKKMRRSSAMNNEKVSIVSGPLASPQLRDVAP